MSCIKLWRRAKARKYWKAFNLQHPSQRRDYRQQGRKQGIVRAPGGSMRTWFDHPAAAGRGPGTHLPHRTRHGVAGRQGDAQIAAPSRNSTIVIACRTRAAHGTWPKQRHGQDGRLVQRAAAAQLHPRCTRCMVHRALPCSCRGDLSELLPAGLCAVVRGI